MKKLLPVSFAIFIIMMLSGCTVNLEQPIVSTSAPAPASTSSSDLGLSGHLIFKTFSLDNNIPTIQIQILDLTTSDIQVTYNVIGNAWLDYLSISPDRENLLFSYTPPFEQGAEAYTSLYTAPVDKQDAMQILFTPATPSDRYTQVEWSPDGKYICFVHYNFQNRATDEVYPHYEIFKMAYPDGQPEKIVDQGFWPRISPDGSKLVCIELDAVTGANTLFVADADGSNPQAITLDGFSPEDVLDAPIFTPDGQSILFSAPDPLQTSESIWLDRLIGVRVVLAHNVPSDWWSVPISGGSVQRLTHLQTVRLFGCILPDQKHFASLSGDGVFVMDLDGSNLTRVPADPTVSSALIWLPDTGFL